MNSSKMTSWMLAAESQIEAVLRRGNTISFSNKWSELMLVIFEVQWKMATVTVCQGPCIDCAHVEGWFISRFIMKFVPASRNFSLVIRQMMYMRYLDYTGGWFDGDVLDTMGEMFLQIFLLRFRLLNFPPFSWSFCSYNVNLGPPFGHKLKLSK